MKMHIYKNALDLPSWATNACR